MVAGFYYHAEFYKLGWIGLLIMGSMVTFIVLKIILYLNYTKYTKGDVEGFLIFKPDEVDLIKHGKIKQIVRPDRVNYLKPGAIYRAKLNVMSDTFFSELIIRGIKIKKLFELSEQDILLTGADSRDEFINRWVTKYGSWRPEKNVRLIRFETINIVEF